MRTETSTEIEERLAAYIREECLPRNSLIRLDPEQDLFETGIVDSAGLISFIAFMEREFGLSIPDEDLLPRNFISISAIAEYVRTHQQAHHVQAAEMRRVGS